MAAGSPSFRSRLIVSAAPVPAVAVSFKAVAGASPATEIIGQIRALIGARLLRAGDRLPSERVLALQFAVSRNSVRQALRSLREQGLLDIRRGAAGGAVIKEGGGLAVRTLLSDLFSLGAIGLHDLTAVRVLVGIEAVRLACERASSADIEQLAANVAQAEAAIAMGDLARRTELNFEFHLLLARMTRNPLLVAITDAVIAVTQRFAAHIERTPNSYVMPFRRRLLRQLRQRDSAAAIEEMRRHLVRQENLYLRASRAATGDSSAVAAPA